jgi:hypothetical protein
MVHVPPEPALVSLVIFVATETTPGPTIVSKSPIDTLSENLTGVVISENNTAADVDLLVAPCTR